MDGDVGVLVVQACHILFTEGHAALSGMAGHVSGRRPGGDTFLIKPVTVGFDEVRVEDLVTADLYGRKLAGAHDVPGETAIHTAVYLARPEVTAVIHTHPPFGTALSCTDQRWLPMTWTVGSLGMEVPTYDPGTFSINTPEEGAGLAAALGPRAAILLKNHGVVVIGRSVAEATIRAVMLENAIRLQWLAGGLGRPQAISREAAARVAVHYDAGRFDRMFAYAARSRRRQGEAG